MVAGGAARQDEMVQVQLTRIEGIMDRILDGQRRVEGDVTQINNRMNVHSDRLASLERDRAERVGAQTAREQMGKTALLIARVSWIAVGGTATAVAAMIARHFGI